LPIGALIVMPPLPDERTPAPATETVASMMFALASAEEARHESPRGRQ